jgi:hypothetical protein
MVAVSVTMNYTMTKRLALHVPMTTEVLNAVATVATAMPMTARLRRQGHSKGQ